MKSIKVCEFYWAQMDYCSCILPNVHFCLSTSGTPHRDFHARRVPATGADRCDRVTTYRDRYRIFQERHWWTRQQL